MNERRSGSLGRILQGYVVRELVFPTTVALAGLTVLVLTRDLLSLSDLIINRGFGATTVAWIALSKVVPLAARLLPFAVLIGVLVGIGRLRADREVLAMEAAGVSSRRLVGPVLVFTAVITAVGLLLSLSVSPWAIRSLEVSLQQIVRNNPGIVLRPGTVHEFDGLKMLVREISARGDQLRGVLVWVPHAKQHLFAGQTIFAEQGVIEPVRNGAAQLVLQDGVTLLPARGREGGETRFETLRTILPDNATPAQQHENALIGMPFGQLRTLAWSGTDDSTDDSDDDRNLVLQARKEVHRRFSYPAACLVFGVLAVSLALLSRRFSRATGGAVGLLVAGAYYGLMQLGDGLVQAGVMSVGVGVWLPNIVVSTLATVLLWRARWWQAWSRKTARQRNAKQEPHRLLRFQRYVLPRYVARHYLQMLILSFSLLLVGYLLIDVLERFHRFARYQAEMIEVIRFYEARIPLLASRMIPMALLLATVLTVSFLSVHRELIAMRACGISVLRVLIPIILIAGVITPGSFLLNEIVVPRTNALADHLQETEIKDRRSGTTPLQMIVWYRTGAHVSHATQLDPILGQAQEISIYELGANGLPVSRTDALAARHTGDGMWELTDPVRIEISAEGLRRVPADSFVQLGEAPSETIDTMHLNVWQLGHEISETEKSGYDATVYRVNLHMKLAAPLACLLLPTVALFFTISGPPSLGPALMLLVSIGLGVSYVLLTGACASFGYGGVLPPSIAGWGPPASLATLACVWAVRNRG